VPLIQRRKEWRGLRWQPISARQRLKMVPFGSVQRLALDGFLWEVIKDGCASASFHYSQSYMPIEHQ
jgi:hypothetical protein